MRELSPRLRTTIISILNVAIFISLGFRLYQIQIIETEKYQKTSEKNAIKEKIIEPYRGIFYDRNWKVLVDNEPGFTLRITPYYFDTSLIPIIENYFKLKPGYIRYLLRVNKSFSPFIPIRVQRGLTFEQISWLEENKEFLQGVDYTVDMQRSYPSGVRGSHLFGYCKEISRKELEQKRDYYIMGDFIGHNGLEKYYEEYLRGIKGKQFVYVDAKGREVGPVNEGKNDIKPVSGYNAQLTIDAELQKLAEELLEGKSGAIVAIDPNNGEILTFVSKPDFDLSNFASMTPASVWRELNSDKRVPLFNRATMSIYPPGSCFKPVNGIAALNDGLIDEKYTYGCGGGFSFGNHFYKCMGTHGGINVVHAIEKSCNTFFFSLILKNGFERWTKYGRMFGFGQKTGIDIYEETSGILPSVEYYNKIYGVNRWTKGYIVSLGVGQGELGVTPLQMAVYTATIANGGTWYRPHAVRKLFNPEANPKEIIIPIEGKKLPIKREAMELIRTGMYLVVNGAGTATHVRIPGINVAGKTGTAQNPHGKDHAWFIGFAPFENPKIAIAVIVENAGFGGAVAAPIAKQLIEFYLKDEIQNKKVLASN
ncbi:MAG: penicillin-binding protein 2 [Ignavibacteria bacterium]|nr:penicillin-binding protein 2 [Ignavibacteria bacterium]